MKILLLHPDDSVGSGPWSGMRWDLVVDLAWAGRSAYARMSQDLKCPVRSVQEVSDPRSHAAKLHELLAVGLGRIVDRHGIDWWEFANPYREPILNQILQAAELAREMPSDAEIVATRPHPFVRVFSEIRHAEIKTFLSAEEGSMASVRHYIRLLRTFSPSGLVQIAFDKWDTDYSVRRWFAGHAASAASRAVLMPSAYRNVTRTQLAYARMLPDVQFLSVVTRRDGRVTNSLPNVSTGSLSTYVARKPNAATERESQSLQKKWAELDVIAESRELQIAQRLGAFKDFPRFIAMGLRVRDAWDAVLNTEKIASVLSADENNPFTRLPIWLARQRQIPTVYAEHGALNFNLGLRVPCSGRYLARSEMMRDYWLRYCHLPEGRIEIGAPELGFKAANAPKVKRDSITFFSSDYQSSGGRVADFYREVLPPLCELARKNGNRVILKLHPFESVQARRRSIEGILTPEQRASVELRSGPLDFELLNHTWAALTVESSAAVECALAGIPTFLCSWFDSAWWGYGEQFVRFGVAQPLNSPDEIADIPNRIRERPDVEAAALNVPIRRERLESILGITKSMPPTAISQNVALP